MHLTQLQNENWQLVKSSLWFKKSRLSRDDIGLLWKEVYMSNKLMPRRKGLFGLLANMCENQLQFQDIKRLG